MNEGRSGLFGLAYTSFVIRMLRGRDVLRGGDASGLSPLTLVELCRGFGAAGAQLDLAQLGAGEPGPLQAVRAAADEAGLFLELSVPARVLEDEEAFNRAAAVSRALGVTVWRVALIYARRYEDFAAAEDWRSFVARWRGLLPRAVSWLEREGLYAGVENHKDFLAPELADLLRAVGSPHLGVCLDFGNNLALLEEPMETVEALAPFTLTTHLKDMAVRRCADGFELSEVPLGRGFLPLRQMVDAVRRTRPDARFCLEMITRDPLPVPYLAERYWVTFAGDGGPRRRAFEEHVLGRSITAALPRISGLTPEAMTAAEDDNVRACVAYAKGELGL